MVTKQKPIAQYCDIA